MKKIRTLEYNINDWAKPTLTEHEKLKEICNKIEYEHETYKRYEWYNPRHWNPMDFNVDLDVREVIFTPEFIDKYIKYITPIVEKNLTWWFWINEKQVRKNIWQEILNRLDNPVDFLYSNIKE